MRTLTEEEIEGLNYLGRALNAPAVWFAQQIQKESNWNPLIKNPRSSARGLIQWVDDTAEDMGYPGGSLEIIQTFPDTVSQLYGPVLDYYKRYAPFRTNAELFLSVFRPADRKDDYNERFPENVIRVNPGIYTPAHYVAYVEGVSQTDRENDNFDFEGMVVDNPGFIPYGEPFEANVTAISKPDKTPDSKKKCTGDCCTVDNERAFIAYLEKLTELNREFLSNLKQGGESGRKRDFAGRKRSSDKRISSRMVGKRRKPPKRNP